MYIYSETSQVSRILFNFLIQIRTYDMPWMFYDIRDHLPKAIKECFESILTFPGKEKIPPSVLPKFKQKVLHA